jgi:hypothetical protein
MGIAYSFSIRGRVVVYRRVDPSGMKSIVFRATVGVLAMGLVSAHAANEAKNPACLSASHQSLVNHLTEEKLIWSQEGGQVRDVRFEPIYREKTNQCFFKLDFKIVKPGELMRTYYLVDAFENRIYAAYLEVARRMGAKPKEPPLNCTYGIAYDEKTACTTKAELDGFVQSLIGQN